MTADDPIARLIPWYAAGTLDAPESAQVETHLPACDACRDLLAIARGFRRLAPQVSQEAVLDHIQSQRLVEFAEDSSALEQDARRFITSHIRACADCAEALEILEDLGSAPAPDEPGPVWAAPAGPLRGKLRRVWDEVWRRLSRTVLHPAPAFAYLLALVVFLVILPFRTPPPGTGSPPPAQVPGAPSPPAASQTRPVVSFVPPALDLPGEVVFRGDAGTPPPVTLPFRGGAEVVALALITDIDQEDLRDPDTTFGVEITQGDRRVFEARRQGRDFDRRGRLTLLLDPAGVSPGVPCLVRLFLVKPGDPRDGEDLYRRSFLLVPNGA